MIAKIILIAALIGFAHGRPGVRITPVGHGHSVSIVHSAVAVPAPLTVGVAPAPVAYTTVVKPIEQHGYQIVY